MRIAVVPQLPNLDRTLNAIENLTFHAAYFGVGRRERNERARELMAQLGLEGRERDQVNDYSGGMAQRLMIARALMHEPQVLILDEPTTGLDPQSRLFLWDQIVELQAKGTTIMLTTHDMVEADRLCQRIAIVDHGQIIALDTPRRAALRCCRPTAGSTSASPPTVRPARRLRRASTPPSASATPTRTTGAGTCASTATPTRSRPRRSRPRSRRT